MLLFIRRVCGIMFKRCTVLAIILFCLVIRDQLESTVFVEGTIGYNVIIRYTCMCLE